MYNILAYQYEVMRMMMNTGQLHTFMLTSVFELAVPVFKKWQPPEIA
jgi:hypothetical protein